MDNHDNPAHPGGWRFRRRTQNSDRNWEWLRAQRGMAQHIKENITESKRARDARAVSEVFACAFRVAGTMSLDQRKRLAAALVSPGDAVPAPVRSATSPAVRRACVVTPFFAN